MGGGGVEKESAELFGIISALYDTFGGDSGY